MTMSLSLQRAGLLVHSLAYDLVSRKAPSSNTFEGVEIGEAPGGPAEKAMSSRRSGGALTNPVPQKRPRCNWEEQPSIADKTAIGSAVSEHSSASDAAGGGKPWQQNASLFKVPWPGVVSGLKHERGFGFIRLDDDNVIRCHERELPDAYLDGREHKYGRRGSTMSCVSRGSHEHNMNCDCLGRFILRGLIHAHLEC